MKVFLSWSGPQSKELAEAIRDWIPVVLQAVTPYFTPSDIEKGTRSVLLVEPMLTPSTSARHFLYAGLRKF